MSRYIITITGRDKESVEAETLLITAESMNTIVKNISHMLLTNFKDIDTCQTINVCIETLKKD